MNAERVHNGLHRLQTPAQDFCLIAHHQNEDEARHMRLFEGTLGAPSKQMNSEFVKQSLRENLARTLVPHVADGLWSIYDSAKSACERNRQPEKTLQTFQNLLTRIPAWSEEILTKEVDRILTASKCDYIEDLLLGVFVSYIRAFAALQQADAAHVQIDFDRPSLSKFIHAFYKLSARKSWSAAYLFKTIGVTSEQQARNRRDIEAMLETALSETIDGFIPWRDISKAYFQAREEPKRAVPVLQEPEPEPETKQPVQFAEANEVHEFETDDEETDDEEGPPPIKLGEEMTLDDVDDSLSVNTEDDLEAKLKSAEPISLNL